MLYPSAVQNHYTLLSCDTQTQHRTTSQHITPCCIIAWDTVPTLYPCMTNDHSVVSLCDTLPLHCIPATTVYHHTTHVYCATMQHETTNLYHSTTLVSLCDTQQTHKHYFLLLYHYTTHNHKKYSCMTHNNYAVSPHDTQPLCCISARHNIITTTL